MKKRNDYGYISVEYVMILLTIIIIATGLILLTKQTNDASINATSAITDGRLNF